MFSPATVPIYDFSFQLEGMMLALESIIFPVRELCFGSSTFGLFRQIMNTNSEEDRAKDR